MDIFSGDAFSLTSLSGTVDKVDYNPGLLGQIGLFQATPIRNRNMWIDRREGKIELVASSANGAPPEELRNDTRNAVPLQAVRLAKGSTIYAAEIAGWRAFGSESEQTAVMTEYNRRRERVRQDIEATHELHRLGALQGKLYDANGELLYDFFDAFGETEAAAVTWALGTNTTDPRALAMTMKRDLLRSAKGAYGQGVMVNALVGDNFFDALIGNAKVRETYLNWNQATALRSDLAFADFEYGGVRFWNYRGTDDNQEIAIGTNEAIFFLSGVPGIYRHAMAPADEFMPYVGAPGQNVYEMLLRDPSGRDAWVRCEEYSYPLYFNQRPDLVRKAVLA